ncbi:lactate utilization protein B/C [Haladaptatus sp. R4]|uniref:LutC/YkgG family protein n=1 Tax=Haladaptatus sp. R4 TaxID=1679489 RepID=UPI0007B4D111|nr:LUD domain-containing protein [Haladaptatus sp. R4]KZN23183.1 lactate utilization protein B/C [Haladaptatus sp. R4]
MPTESTTAFESSLRNLDVPCTVTTVDDFPDALDEVIERPAVGVDLDIDGVSLDDADVTRSPSTGQLADAKTGITPAALGVAAHGSLVLQSTPDGTEPVSLYPPRHVAVVRESDIVPDVRDALDWLDGEFEEGLRSAVFATGVSATGDMGALVEGVHGPAEVRVIVVEGR